VCFAYTCGQLSGTLCLQPCLVTDRTVGEGSVWVCVCFAYTCGQLSGTLCLQPCLVTDRTVGEGSVCVCVCVCVFCVHVWSAVRHIVPAALLGDRQNCRWE
jgi:hypothetical protein